MCVIGRSQSSFSGTSVSSSRTGTRPTWAHHTATVHRRGRAAPRAPCSGSPSRVLRRAGAAGARGRSRGRRAPGGRRRRSSGGSSPSGTGARRRRTAGPCRWRSSGGRRRGRPGRRSRCRATRRSRTRRRSRRSGPSARRRDWRWNQWPGRWPCTRRSREDVRVFGHERRDRRGGPPRRWCRQDRDRVAVARPGGRVDPAEEDLRAADATSTRGCRRGAGGPRAGVAVGMASPEAWEP